MELKKALLTKCQQQRFLSISRRLKIGSSMDVMGSCKYQRKASGVSAITFGSVVKRIQ
jgi:hypothetical protein